MATDLNPTVRIADKLSTARQRVVCKCFRIHQIMESLDPHTFPAPRGSQNRRNYKTKTLTATSRNSLGAFPLPAPCHVPVLVMAEHSPPEKLSYSPRWAIVHCHPHVVVALPNFAAPHLGKERYRTTETARPWSTITSGERRCVSTKGDHGRPWSTMVDHCRSWSVDLVDHFF